MTELLSPQALAAVEKVTKLLTLARDQRGNENEMQAALDMAHRILETHNLDMALVERRAGDSTSPHAKREDKTSGGGLYKWQREVWENTAKLNMCVYISIKGLERGQKYENRLVGRPENVIMTRVMAEYLQEAVERLAVGWVQDRYPAGTSRFVKEAIIFREGVAERLGERLRSLHEERVRESRIKKAEDEARAKHPGAAGTGTSLVLIDIMGSEADLNNDYMQGLELGTTAQNRREYEARNAAAHAKRTMWKEDRVEFHRVYSQEDALEMVRQDKRVDDVEKYYRGEHTDTYGPGFKEKKVRPSRAMGWRRENESDRRRGSSAFGQGRVAGDNVSLSAQVGHTKRGRLS